MAYKTALFSAKNMGALMVCAGLAAMSSAAPAAAAPSAQSPVLSQYIQQLAKAPQRNVLIFNGGGAVRPYALFVHSPAILPLIKNQYNAASLDAVIKATQAARRIDVKKRPWGSFIEAASFASANMAAETNYDAIWLRDSVWGYLALAGRKDTQPQARRVLLTLWDYMATPQQTERMKAIIADPALVNAENGQMNVPHIRFNGASPQFADVQENGAPQPWAHKQNDALGLFIDAALRGVAGGEITAAEWRKDHRLDALIYLVAYLDKAKFYQMEDSGAWEEDPRLNTSSVGLVTSALENLQSMQQQPAAAEKPFIAALQARAKELKLAQFISEENLARLVNAGYKTIDKQLSQGGESPDYPKTDPRFRQADAALLSLIYPARLHRLSIQQKEQILDIVGSLMGDMGIRRYWRDDYQSANFWFHDIKADTEASSHEARKKQFIPGTEAQWFFDSWYAKSALIVYKESKNPYYQAVAVRSMNRALAQITGENMTGANGLPVIAQGLPESYNFIAGKEGELWEAPSPIIPLNWSKASMTLMLEEMKADLR